MSLDKNQTISAQVILRPASGKSIDPSSITAANIGALQPSPDAVARASSAFRSLGFEVGNIVGNNFSIAGPAHRFEDVFDAPLRRGERGELEALQEDGSSRYELPLERLPPSLREVLETVTFSPPLDFGPTRP